MQSKPDVKKILETLKAGNSHFVMGMRTGDITGTRRQELLAGQHPMVSVLSCSDSRVAPDFIFDRGLGEIFVVRTAGNIVDNIALGSLEYGAEHLGTPLLLVLGHTRCGAVTAACEGGHVAGHIKNIVDEIKPAVEEGFKLIKTKKDDPVYVAIIENIKRMVKVIPEKSEILHHLVKKGSLQIMGALYKLESGEVEFFS
jgi:carbonic anhydrase